MTTIPDASQGLSLREAAVYMGVHYNTIRNWVNEGQVPHTRFGPHGHIIRIHKSDLDVMKRQAGSTPEGGRVA